MAVRRERNLVLAAAVDVFKKATRKAPLRRLAGILDIQDVAETRGHPRLWK
jgi:hypothetical protein